MPTYIFKHKETGEITEVTLPISQLDQYKEDHPELESQITAPQIITNAKSTLSKAGKDWENHLDRMKKGSGKGNTIHT